MGEAVLEGEVTGEAELGGPAAERVAGPPEQPVSETLATTRSPSAARTCLSTMKSSPEVRPDHLLRFECGQVRSHIGALRRL
jgi:hypothetical protein